MASTLHTQRNYSRYLAKSWERIICSKSAARVEIKLSLSPLTKFGLIPQQFEDKKMKILRSLVDRDAVVWIWCHSNNALQKLDNRDGLKKLIEIVHQTVEATTDVLENKTKTNIDHDHLKKNIVSMPLVFVDFRTTLNFYRESLSENTSSYSNTYRVIDVTKLKTKIYVLCMIGSWDNEENSSVSTMICDFEDRSPYPIVEEILLRRFDSYSRASITNEFRGIVASVKENCLYLLASSEKENYHADEVIRVEIKENEDNSPKRHSKWLELEEGYHPSVLSISKDDDLMMVSSFLPIILRIYDSDARLRLSVSLHGDMLKTRKAVETSNGNFIILHSMEKSTEYTDDSDKAKEMNEYSVLYKREKEDDSLELRDVVWTVSEVSRDGKTIIRRFIPQNQEQQLSFLQEGDISIGSKGRVFVADTDKHRVIILNSYLRWVGILIPQINIGDENEKLQWPLRLFYDENWHDIIVLGRYKVHIYDIICK